LLTERNRFGNQVADGVRMPERSRHVAHRGARHHGAKGADLHDFFVAIFTARVINEFVAPKRVDIHINIRCAGSLRIEKTLEGHVELYWINGGNAA
jgi:hypothetical protein